LKKRSKKLLVLGGVAAALPKPAMSKSFLLLFFKKEALASALLAVTLHVFAALFYTFERARHDRQCWGTEKRWVSQALNPSINIDGHTEGRGGRSIKMVERALVLSLPLLVFFS
jgi:hypothetical protein